MSKSILELLWFQLRKIRLELMNYPVGSKERLALIEDARQIEMALTSGEVGAA